MKRLIAACVAGFIALGLWWVHREWWERFAPIVPFAEPFDEPGGGFDWPPLDIAPYYPSFSNGDSALHFTFTDGTTGPGRWNSSTGQIEKAEATA